MLNDKIGKILTLRLEESAKAWLAAFQGVSSTEMENENSIVQIKPCNHEFIITNQVLELKPHVETSRESWIRQLQSWLGVACWLPRLSSSRFKLGVEETAERDFKHLVIKM